MSFYSDIFLWPLFAGLIGVCIGSLLNVVIYRLPLMMQQEEKALVMDYLSRQSPAKPLIEETSSARLNLFLPRSHCPNCKHRLAWYDNIPLFSWLLLAGRCRKCQHRIGLVYPAVELSMAVIATWLACYRLPGSDWVMIMTFSALLLSLAVIDFRHQILPDILTLSLLWCGLFWHWLQQPDFLGDAVLGAIGGYLVLWTLYWGMWFMTKKEGLGYGDFKLLAALGAWLGWQKLPEILLLASTATLIVTLLCSKKRAKGWSQPQPFGPGLCAAGVIYLMLLL
ncbi:prepilin peptidase [Serratia proteamaculans]|uniref:Prepilin leader peptidase/N-methyltransferase n=1 Tax=Serratia proteamaculans TaxID=28151 RepID=A0A5Q2VCM7_SERPR|nr:A24 family peptidase [Serratia proteamaculans]QGH61924.1 prepilin peptidase [Serratia proteamaculans]